MASAVDGISIEEGKSGNSAEMTRVGAQWDWNKRWFDNGGWHLGGYWDADIGYWRGKAAIGYNKDITEIGFTPVFRYQRNDKILGLIPYAEGAVGIHFLSGTQIYLNRKFGSSFQFGDHLGVGMLFGSRSQYDLGYRFQHLSNGSIKQPNQGINFNQIRFAYHF